VDHDDFDLSTARACAHALGVCYFASWSASRIILWDAIEGKAHQELPVPEISNAKQTHPFEQTLVALMDQLRILAVLGTCPPQKLSYWHLANLFFATNIKAQAALTKHLRSQPQLHNRQLTPVNTRAQDKIHICTARMLTLTYFDMIPHNLQPENLDTALRYLVSELPTQQFSSLSGETNECELDEESAVALHHLLHRLSQVAMFQDKTRAEKLLRQLLIHSAPCADNTNNGQCRNGDIYLYCNNITATTDNGTPTKEIDKPARLALKQLLRTLSGEKSEPQSSQTIFAVHAETFPRKTAGFLYNSNRPDIPHRNSWLKCLKLAWSGVNFELPKTTPTWAYEFIYLLGILAPHSELCLSVPTGLFSSEYSQILIKLLQRNFTLHSISQTHSAMVSLNATKENDSTATTRFCGRQKRTMAWSALSAAEPEVFALALNLDEPLFQLITQGDLSFNGEDGPIDPAGTAAYLKSSLAETLRRHLMPSGTSKWQPRIPAPRAIVLDTLATIDGNGAIAKIDRELEKQLNLSTAPPLPVPHNSAASSGAEIVQKKANKEIRQKIINLVTVNGIPHFPDHYLYDYYRPQLISYPQGSKPWQIASEFMGTFQLSTPAPETECSSFEVNNEYLACAIVLTSYGSGPIKLPADVSITEKIIKRYLTDLSDLRDTIWSEAHAALAQHEAANRMVSKIWKTLELPSWKIVDSFLTRLAIRA